VELINSGMTGLFDLLFLPFSRLAPLWSLTVFSVVTGILMLWIFGLVSNQEAIRTIRDRIRGNLIAVRLFGDDLGLLFRLQGRLLRDNVVFLKYALIPLLVMIVPVLVILIQLNLRFGARPLEPGEAVLVKVTLRDAAAIERGVSLEAPAGVAVETPGVRVPALREVAWRIRPEQPGRYRLSVRAGDEAVEKELRVGEGWGATSALRTGKTFFDVLLYPGEPPISSRAVESIEIKYKPLELELLGWSVNWLVFFFLLSILAGFAFRRVLGVEI
jgi:uncharacterized membrane protein (DUF106 family)